MRLVENSVDAALGELVRLYRLSSGLSQVELGEAAGISYQQIQKYESGANKVSVSRLFSVARALGVTPSDLLAELERRTEGTIAGADHNVPVEAVQFLASRRGRDVVRAMAACDDPRLLDAFIELFMSTSDDDAIPPQEEAVRQTISL